MKRIDTMAALVPTKADTVPHPGRNRDKIMSSHEPTIVEDSLGKKKMLRLCQNVPELSMLVKINKKTIKHTGKKDEVKYVPVLAMNLTQATTIVNRFASQRGLTLLAFFNQVMNPKKENTDSKEEEE